MRAPPKPKAEKTVDKKRDVKATEKAAVKKAPIEKKAPVEKKAPIVKEKVKPKTPVERSSTAPMMSPKVLELKARLKSQLEKKGLSPEKSSP